MAWTHQGSVFVSAWKTDPVWGAGTFSPIGKTHLAIAIARALIRDGRRGRFINVVELVNKREAQGRLAGQLGRLRFVVPTNSASCLSPRPAGSFGSA
jgi:hypothetical protein